MASFFWPTEYVSRMKTLAKTLLFSLVSSVVNVRKYISGYFLEWNENYGKILKITVY